MQVRNILNVKGDRVYSVSPMVTVLDALTIMAHLNIGSLIVMDGARLAGIFSERDYARKVILKGKFSKDVRVEEVMHAAVSVTEDDDVKHCMKLMTDKYIRHLPVVRDETVVGVVSIGDVVKAVISEQEFLIENLSSYISGSK